MKKFKENSIYCTQHREALPDARRWEDLFMFATAEEDTKEILAGEPARNGETTWSARR